VKAMKMVGVEMSVQQQEVIDVYYRVENVICTVDEPSPAIISSALANGNIKTKKVPRHADRGSLSSRGSESENVRRRNVATIKGAKVGNSPNRWPLGLPFARHNLYWVKQTASPCVCIGLDRGASCAFLRIVTICSSTYHHEISVAAGALESFQSHMVVSSTDEAFALAMIDFHRWEASKQVEGWSEMVWYYYPGFIYKFFQHPPTWSSWRKQAERVSRGKNEDRRESYFAALVTEVANLPADDLLNRVQLGKRLPWNDEISDSDDESMEGSRESGIESMSEEDVVLAPQQAPIVAQKKLKLSRKVKDEVVDVALLEDTSSKPPKELRTGVPWSAYNLYWLPRASLPCLFRDGDELVRKDVFVVQPVCCVTYHYSVKVPTRQLDPLTWQLLKKCTDERTQDFTVALIEFADWQASMDAVEGGVNAEIATALRAGMLTNEPHSYLWPQSIFELIGKPAVWAAWRKNAERRISSSQNLNRKACYLEALKADYIALAEEQADIARSATDDRNEKGHIEEAPAIHNSNISPLSMYWIDKAALPCIQTDLIADPRHTKHVLQPICCETYHYKVTMTTRNLKPISSSLLRMCSDERTQDFTLALIEFGGWLREGGTDRDISLTTTSSVVDGAQAGDPGVNSGIGGIMNVNFVWPTFVCDLIQNPKLWSAWRKTSERKHFGRQTPRKNAYLASLLEDYRTSVNSV
jgi:hypothetical protein